MIKKHVVLFTEEFFPYTAGGLGMFCSKLLTELSENSSLSISIITYNFDTHVINQIKQAFKNVNVVEATSFVEKIPVNLDSLQSPNLYKSLLYAFALEAVHNSKKVDIVEFYDFFGVGFVSLWLRRNKQIFKGVIFIVRNHTTIQEIENAEGYIPLNNENRYVYFAEKQSIKFADYIFVASTSQGKYFSSYFDILQKKCRVSGMPFAVPEKINRKKQSQFNIFFIGKSQYVKGLDILVQAFVLLSEKHPNINLHIIGGDLQSNIPPYENGSIKIMKNVPKYLHKHIVWHGRKSHVEIDELLQFASCAVVPSRLESFCYVAHELYHKGIPLILNKLPSFVDFFENSNSLFFNGEVDDLKNKLENILMKNYNSGYAEIKYESSVIAYLQLEVGQNLTVGKDEKINLETIQEFLSETNHFFNNSLLYKTGYQTKFFRMQLIVENLGKVIYEGRVGLVGKVLKDEVYLLCTKPFIWFKEHIRLFRYFFSKKNK